MLSGTLVQYLEMPLSLVKGRGNKNPSRKPCVGGRASNLFGSCCDRVGGWGDVVVAVVLGCWGGGGCDAGGGAVCGC